MSWEALDVAEPPPARVDSRADGFRVLGPLEVVAGGRSVPLGSPAQRALLAVLILRAGEVVAVDTLIDALWGDRPPESAANLIQVYVARLRAALEPGRRRGERPRLLVTRAPGYILAVPAEQIDARRFELLVTQARQAVPQVAAVTLREALALWRGPLLADLPDRGFARAEGIRLEGLRRAALDARLEADLALGGHAALIPELEALVAADPLRERFWGQLMVALCRAGHPARALAAYETARTMLANELGLDPSPELQQLAAAILRQDASLEPAPQPMTFVNGNLPVPLTSFVGRAEELAHVQRLVARSRLVTVVGVGGAGKTRLALQAAAAVAGEFRDGVWLVDLAPVTDPARVPSALAGVLEVRDEPGRSLTTTLSDYLRGAQALVVLDNCEHLVEACAELAAALLGTCPAVRVLATSREVLAVPGEAVWSLPPLSESEAVTLFSDRAAAVDSFRLSSQTAPFVVQICRHLDGIPLAIELAAARLQALPVHEIAERLDDRFRLLSHMTQGTPARHRTLRGTVDWSYDLLCEPERALFDRLSVFAGGFTLDGVEAVGGLGADTVGVLAQLVDKSFVLRMQAHAGELRMQAHAGELRMQAHAGELRTQGHAGELRTQARPGATRYRLLETLRQYGLERLAERGETDSVRRRHAAYALALAEQAMPACIGSTAGPDAPLWLDRLDAERANLRMVLAWAFDGGDVALGVRLTGVVWWLWLLRGPLGEGRQLIKTALEHCGGDTAARAALLSAAGFLAASQCDYEQAMAAAEQCLGLARRHNDERHAALALHGLGVVAWAQGDYERSSRLLEETAAITRGMGDRWHLAQILALLGGLLFSSGTHARAAILLDESVQLAREVGEPSAIGFALGFRAQVAQQQQDDERAAAFTEESLASYRAVGHAAGIAQALATLAVVVERRGDDERAMTVYRECLALCRKLRCRRGAAMCLEGLARVAARWDQTTTAGRLLGAADALRAEIGAPVLASERADHDHCVATARAALGLSAFRAAWAAGHALALEQAFAEVQSLESVGTTRRARQCALTG
jgi:predicted ATPase/DNA-binding SARP family transcriptional activator